MKKKTFHLITFFFCFLNFSFAQFPGIIASFNVTKELNSKNSNGENIHLATLDYEGRLFVKNAFHIYWDSAKYFDKYFDKYIIVKSGNTGTGTTISLDSIQNIQYANTDSNIWRSFIWQPTDEKDFAYYKGFIAYGARKWKFLPETRDINGLTCQHAQLLFGSNLQWDVWFCKDIPVNFGPYGMYDLPGLLVEGSYKPGHMNYKLTAYQITDAIDDKVFWPAELSMPVDVDFTIQKKK